MASLRRVAGSPYYIACITLSDGTRTNRSTKTTDKRAAMRLAREWQSISNRARQAEFRDNQCEGLRASSRDNGGPDNAWNPTLESFLTFWLDGKKGTPTGRRYRGTINAFVAAAGERKNGSLSQVDYRIVIEFMEARRNAGLSSGTLALDLKILGNAFNIGKKLGLIDHNPVEQARAVRGVRNVPIRRACFSMGQVDDLLKVSSPDWTTLILLGLYTGARLRDCATMSWEHVDFENGALAYTPSKTVRLDKKVCVPLHPRLMEHLSSKPRVEGERFLCPSLAGSVSGGKNGLSNQFRILMARAGIDSNTTRSNRVRPFAHLTFHSLRYTFISAMAERGIPPEVRSKLAGHSVRVNRDYTNLPMSALFEAVNKLPTV